ncbi:MAG: hypothetical protein EBU52_00170 [Cytophagia bacterium]|nr:hypothetical protein [Cytophagia bacterium]
MEQDTASKRQHCKNTNIGSHGFWTMSKLVIIIMTASLNSCIQGAITPQLRSLFSTNNSYAIVSMDTVKSTDMLFILSCKSQGLATYFNFLSGEFSNRIDNQSIPLKIIGYECGAEIINVNVIKITQTKDGFEINSSKGERANLANLIKINQLNLGQDPSLSENPKELIITIKIIEEDLLGAGQLTKIIVDSYLDALKQQGLFDPNEKNINKLIRLGADYPLNLRFE